MLVHDRLELLVEDQSRMVENAQTKQAQAGDLLKHSALTYKQIAACIGCSLGTVRLTARLLGVCRKPQRKIAP